jgi:hypothetical protein
MVAGEEGLLFPPIAHLLEKLFHIGEPYLLIARPKISSEGVKLARGDLVSLDRVGLAVKRSHVLKEASGDLDRRPGLSSK